MKLKYKLYSCFTQKVEKEEALKKLNDELNSKNDELVKANSDLEHFSNILSHDLQEPLRKIQVYSDVIAEKTIDRVEKNIFSKIIKSADRMRGLIKNTLDYARTGKTDTTFEKVDLDKVLVETLTDLEIKISEKKR